LQRYSCAKADEEACDAKSRAQVQEMQAAEAQKGVQRQQVLWVRVTGTPITQFYSIYLI
jgi:hypothetical protein